MPAQKLLIKNIKRLVSVYEKAPAKLSGAEMRNLPGLDNAWLACEDGRIAAYGSMEDFPGISDWKDLEVLDASGKLLLPGFVDSHTHLVYAGSREKEFVDRINGLSYEEIAKRGGGILNSAKSLRACNEDELFSQSKARLHEIISQGTVAVEIKSGYGLDLDSELKMLRVIRRLKELKWIPVKATFLGAHAIPEAFKNNKAGYLNLIITQMLPEIAKEGLADYIDAFCEKNYFDASDCRALFEAAAAYGIRARLHAEQLSHNGGVEVAVACKAASVDHLEYISDNDIKLLSGSDTMPTILPGAAFFLNLPLPPARKMIDSGLPVAFASDYNPGSSPSGNMKLMMSLACIQYKLNPEEALNAVTLNTAYSLDLQNELGTISPGKQASFILTKAIPGLEFLPYSFGSDSIDQVYVNGRKWE